MSNIEQNWMTELIFLALAKIIIKSSNHRSKDAVSPTITHNSKTYFR